MKALPWLRLYTEIIDDEKLGLLAFEDRWHFVALLCLKGKGVLDSEPDMEMLWRKVAFKMGLTGAELEKVVARLSRMNLIDRETLQPVAWDKRQMQSDTDPTAADRKRKQREREKLENKSAGATNSDVTTMSRVTVTDVTRTDTDTDKEREEGKKQPRAGALSRPDDVAEQTWADWSQLRKTKKAPVTQTVLNGARREAAKAGIPLETFLQIWCVRGSQGMQAEWITANDLKQAGAQSQQSSVGRFV